MTLKGKLLTKDRIQKWDPGFVNTCALCKTDAESRNLLFFQCEYAKRIWDAIKCLIQLDQCSELWNDVVSNITQKTPNGKIWSTVQRITWSASVYCIWY